MNDLIKSRLNNFLQQSKTEVNTVRTLYLVMEKVGGYKQLMNLSLPALNEILKCMEHFAREKEKALKRKR